ncbi:MAG: ArsA family ATPase, partial [Cyanobacteria bacterium P01_H01_bin.121]
MTFILTFLGKGGTGRTTIAIAAARQYADQGKRTLLIGQDSGPAFSMLLGQPVTTAPEPIATNLSVVQLQTALLLERSWDDLKQLETQYLRTPFFSNIYGQELPVLPGLDSALALNELRQYVDQAAYDVIIFDGSSGHETLRMAGMPDVLQWYVRRFSKVFVDSDLGRAVMPFAQPVMSAVLTVNWSDQRLQEPTNQMNNLLETGRQFIADPEQFAAYLVATPDPIAIATARHLWGVAQQVSLTVGGVLLNQAGEAQALEPEFTPLPVTALPTASTSQSASAAIQAALPDFQTAQQAPRAIK